MPGRVRTRTRTIAPSGVATALNSALTDIYSPVGTLHETCTDIVGNYPNPNPLNITANPPSFGWIVNGRVWNWWDCKGFLAGPSPSWAGNGDPGIPSDDALFAQGLASSNPNKPGVFTPVFLFELKDIPRMVKDWGAVLARKPSFSGGQNLKELPYASAKTYIEYQFGIAPFIDDLRKLLDFQGGVERKLDTINRLGQPGGSVRKATVYRSEIFPSGPKIAYATSLYQEARQVQYLDSFRRRYWTSTRWKPLTPLPKTAEDRRWLAVRLAYGLDISFSTLWEGMPWSWLIDWFSNVGDILAQTRNTVPVSHHDACLMKTVTIERKILSTFVPGTSTLSIQLPPNLGSVKTRTVLGDGLPQIRFDIPFLTGNQLAILGSLAVLKGRNR